MNDKKKLEKVCWENFHKVFDFMLDKDEKKIELANHINIELTKKTYPKSGKALGKTSSVLSGGLAVVDGAQTIQEDQLQGVKLDKSYDKVAWKELATGTEMTLTGLIAELSVALLYGESFAPGPFGAVFGLIAFDVFELAACAIVAHEIVETLGDDPDNWDEFFWSGYHVFRTMDENAVRTAKWQAEGVRSKQQGEYELAKLIYHVSKEFGHRYVIETANRNYNNSKLDYEASLANGQLLERTYYKSKKGFNNYVEDIARRNADESIRTYETGLANGQLLERAYYKSKKSFNSYVEDTALRNADASKLDYETGLAMARVLEQAFHVTKDKAAEGSREAYDDIKKLYDKALVFFSRLVADTKAKGKKIYFNFERDFKQTLLNHKPVGSVEQLYLSLEPDIREFVDKHFFYDYNGNITSFGHEHNEHYMNVMRSVEPVFPTDIFDFREIPDEKLEVNSNSEIKGFLFLLQQEAGNINYSPSEQHYILDGYYQFIDYSKTHLDFKSRKKELEDILHEVKNKLIDYKNFAY